jgi:hypothetical protein
MRKESAMTDSIQRFLDQWSTAEHTGDTEWLQALLAGDFAGIGPLGFTLPKQAWLARHRSGDLRYHSFAPAEVQARAYGQAAVVTVRANTPGSYQGHPIPEATRATLVPVHQAGGWLLAAIHLSFIADTAGAPPLPGTASRPDAQPAQPQPPGRTR